MTATHTENPNEMISVQSYLGMRHKLQRATQTLMQLGLEPRQNITLLTGLAGEVLGGATALYNRLAEGLLCSWGQWNSPPGYNPVDAPVGHICYDLIQRGGEDVLHIRNLPETEYYHTDPNVRLYNLRTYIGCPVRINDETLGSLCVVFQKDFTPGEEDLWMLQAIAAAIALQEKRLQTHIELEQNENFLTRLNEITRSALESPLLHDTLQTLADHMAELFTGADGCYITLWDSERKYTIPAAASGTLRETYPRRRSQPNELTLTESVLRERRVLAVEDVFHSEYVSPRISQQYFTKSTLGIPLIAGDKPLGAALIAYNERHAFTPQEISRGEQVGQLISLAVSKAILLDTTQRQIKELSALNALAVVSTQVQDEDSLIERFNRVLEEVFNPTNYGVLLRDSQQPVLHVHPSYHFNGDMVNQPLPLGQGLAGMTALDGQPRMVGDVTQEMSYYQISPHTNSILVAPMLMNDQVIGVINVESHQIDAYSESDLQLLQTLAGQFTTTMERLRLFTAERRRRQVAETLQEAAAVLTASLDIAQVLENILIQVERAIPYDSACVFLIEEDHMRAVAGRGFPPGVPVVGQVYPLDDVLLRETQKTGEPIILVNAQEHPAFMKWGETTYIRGWMGVPLIVRGKTIGFVTFDSKQAGTYNEETARLAKTFANHAAVAISNARLFAETDRHLQQLHALRLIDIAITSSLDLRVILNLLLDQIMTQLGVDAAAFLLLNASGQTLDYSTGAGFRSLSLTNLHLRLGDGLAGKAALERRAIYISDLQSADHPLGVGISLTPEAFTEYYAAPLIAKGQIKGVLNLFHRGRLKIDAEWLSFLEACTTQAAIAVDNSALFENLQRSNLELTLAYDNTLEGWSRALDLRDRETEGHTRRVTELAWELAQAMGMEEISLIQIRRGALLHDIGKMGIPDAVLQKDEEDYTESDWETIRKHPIYAYQLLSPIPFLRSALDIPYYHHENFDGSGFPRGLKGEQIPLSARIFSVVNTYDLLRQGTSRQPAKTHAEILQYLREQSGKMFDPLVVAAFEKMMQGK